MSNASFCAILSLEVVCLGLDGVDLLLLHTHCSQFRTSSQPMCIWLEPAFSCKFFDAPSELDIFAVAECRISRQGASVALFVGH